ncbi:MAG: HAD family hydrolase [Bryobacterales bacterium]|nr:HAD family hydrolase [Acidobacteriota bacterium]MCB9383754.1 HAD family hydrolase [Bryobacterales bacterium]
MKPYGYLIDMDGVIYRGVEAIPGAADFINYLTEERVPYLFLTNNSAYAQLDVVAKLRKFDIDTTTEHVYTSALATAEFVSQQRPGGAAFVIGEGGLLNALNQVNYAISSEHADYVIVGEGRTMNFEVMERAHRLIEKGAQLISTNADTWCPTDSGPRPGCGAIVALLESATGRTAYHVGKPNPFMMRLARKKLGLRTDEVTMIGDTMETDIRGAVDLGFRSVLVLTGSTRREDLKNYPYAPTVVAESIAKLAPEYALAVA